VKERKRKGGFIVRWFLCNEGKLIEGSLLKTGVGDKSYRWRMAIMGSSYGFAFGKVGTSVEANRDLTEAAKMFSLRELEDEPDAEVTE